MSKNDFFIRMLILQCAEEIRYIANVVAKRGVKRRVGWFEQQLQRLVVAGSTIVSHAAVAAFPPMAVIRVPIQQALMGGGNLLIEKTVGEKADKAYQWIANQFYCIDVKHSVFSDFAEKLAGILDSQIHRLTTDGIIKLTEVIARRAIYYIAQNEKDKLTFTVDFLLKGALEGSSGRAWLDKKDVSLYKRVEAIESIKNNKVETEPEGDLYRIHIFESKRKNDFRNSSPNHREIFVRPKNKTSICKFLNRKGKIKKRKINIDFSDPNFHQDSRDKLRVLLEKKKYLPGSNSSWNVEGLIEKPVLYHQGKKVLYRTSRTKLKEDGAPKYGCRIMAEHEIALLENSPKQFMEYVPSSFDFFMMESGFLSNTFAKREFSLTDLVNFSESRDKSLTEYLEKNHLEGESSEHKKNIWCFQFKDVGKSIRNKHLKLIFLEKDLSGTDLSDLSELFAYCKMKSIKIELVVKDSTLHNTRLHGVDFFDASVLFVNSDFSGAVLNQARFSNVTFRNVKFQNADCTSLSVIGKDNNAKFDAVDFTGANLTSACFNNVTIGQIWFIGATLDQSKFDNIQYESLDVKKKVLKLIEKSQYKNYTEYKREGRFLQELGDHSGALQEYSRALVALKKGENKRENVVLLDKLEIIKWRAEAWLSLRFYDKVVEEVDAALTDLKNHDDLLYKLRKTDLKLVKAEALYESINYKEELNVYHGILQELHQIEREIASRGDDQLVKEHEEIRSRVFLNNARVHHMLSEMVSEKGDDFYFESQEKYENYFDSLAEMERPTEYLIVICQGKEFFIELSIDGVSEFVWSYDSNSGEMTSVEERNSRLRERKFYENLATPQDEHLDEYLHRMKHLDADIENELEQSTVRASIHMAIEAVTRVLAAVDNKGKVPGLSASARDAVEEINRSEEDSNDEKLELADNGSSASDVSDSNFKKEEENNLRKKRIAMLANTRLAEEIRKHNDIRIFFNKMQAKRHLINAIFYYQRHLVHFDQSVTNMVTKFKESLAREIQSKNWIGIKDLTSIWDFVKDKHEHAWSRLGSIENEFSNLSRSLNNLGDGYEQLADLADTDTDKAESYRKAMPYYALDSLLMCFIRSRAQLLLSINQKIDNIKQFETTPYYNMGMVYIKLAGLAEESARNNIYGHAIGFFKEAMRVQPTFERAHIQCGWVLMATKKFTEAKWILKMALVNTQNNPVVVIAYAEALLRYAIEKGQEDKQSKATMLLQSGYDHAERKLEEIEQRDSEYTTSDVYYARTLYLQKIKALLYLEKKENAQELSQKALVKHPMLKREISDIQISVNHFALLPSPAKDNNSIIPGVKDEPKELKI